MLLGQSDRTPLLAGTTGGSGGMSEGGEGNGGGIGVPRNNARGGDGGSQRAVSSDGLNPSRQKGFGPTASRRIETPTLNDMRAWQGAVVVGKFMNFMHRKNTIVMDLYDRAFYAKRPSWESLANFVYSDLCPSADLRREQGWPYRFWHGGVTVPPP